MHFTHQLSALRGLRVRIWPVLSLLALSAQLSALSFLASGCSTFDPAAHHAKVAALRERTPYLTRIGSTHSMSTVVPAGGTELVRPLPYQRLQSGHIVVYWPAASANPVCHFVKRRIGTDSWETAGMNQPGDLSWLGLLTRENYIGVIQ